MFFCPSVLMKDNPLSLIVWIVIQLVVVSCRKLTLVYLNA